MNELVSPSLPPAVTIRPFQPDDAEDFRQLNEEWIEAYFLLEEKDREILGRPEDMILAPGGRIFMAEIGGRTVGCVALLPLPDGSYEVAKMAVSPQSQGQGIGRRLLETAIDWARTQQAPRLYLESNARLAPALRLYEAVGFRHLPSDGLPPSPYARADVFMEMRLDR